MANRSIFSTLFGKRESHVDTVNHENAPAYAFTHQHQLAQFAATGCFNSTFYADGRDQLERLIECALQVESDFVAKTAIYSRKKGHIKDMPAFLTAYLSLDEGDQFPTVFNRVIDNGKMLRNFVQVMRSGAVGRYSLGSRPRRLVKEWLNEASDKQLIQASVGQSPSLADVIKMVHPKPDNAKREALFGYFLGRPYDASLLPEELKQFEAFKKDRNTPLPDVPFQMLTSLDLTAKDWAMIAKRAGWHMLRMNLNTFARQGVYEIGGMIQTIANRLQSQKEIQKARVFPYQIMAAWSATGDKVPIRIKDALEKAMEMATENVPCIKGRIAICVDVSGSMNWSATGFRQGSTSKVRCVDVAALITSTLWRRNDDAIIIPFEHKVINLRLNPHDGIMKNAKKLASVGGGGTNCSAPLERLNRKRSKVDLVVMVSDNESWVDARHGKETEMMRQWYQLKRRNPQAKLVCIDLTPNETTQALDSRDILNIGGFSDSVFSILGEFAKKGGDPQSWVNKIDQIQLEGN
ncbi:vWA domain-containing protein [Magnetococcales bacterium HHB-1]